MCSEWVNRSIAVSTRPQWRRDSSSSYIITRAARSRSRSRSGRAGAAGHPGLGYAVGWGWPTGRVRSDTGRNGYSLIIRYRGSAGLALLMVMVMAVMTTTWMIRKPIMAQLYVAPNGLRVLPAVLAGPSHALPSHTQTQNDDTYIIIAAQIHTNQHESEAHILCIFGVVPLVFAWGSGPLMSLEVGAKPQSSIVQLRFRSPKSSGTRSHLRTAWSSIGP
ncbi:uncharacterized protein LOC122615082 [Drosophila teissieri]|uniref:uncharacterized protein LOC122615082 n=1 Tax=Drosophila teissieri TaxID=7243 RepID=UPI001CBA309E|nr:uncharacterized protein LOC122615082 [Drosophila teissieri]